MDFTGCKIPTCFKPLNEVPGQERCIENPRSIKFLWLAGNHSGGQKHLMIDVDE